MFPGFQNERKYEDAKNKYDKTLNTALDQAQKILENRFNLLNPVVLKVKLFFTSFINFDSKLITSQHDALDKMVTSFRPLEKIENDMQKLKQEVSFFN